MHLLQAILYNLLKIVSQEKTVERVLTTNIEPHYSVDTLALSWSINIEFQKFCQHIDTFLPIFVPYVPLITSNVLFLFT